jgi:hypothetical protein
VKELKSKFQEEHERVRQWIDEQEKLKVAIKKISADK